MSISFFLGVDGGGTGCRARIVDASGAILGEGKSGPATFRQGLEGAWAAVSAAADAAAQQAGFELADLARTSTGVALAGVGRKGATEQLAALPHPYAKIAFTNDAHAALLGAHSGRDGAIVIAGTGSIALGTLAGREIRLGGYGFPVSDEGSGADLGLKAIQLALRGQDGRRAMTPLLEEIMQRFQNDPFEIVTWMDQATASNYAEFAPMVVRHAGQGDAAAREIVVAAAEHIDTYVRTLQSLGAPRVSLLGGLAQPIESWLAEDVRNVLQTPEGDAVSGAIILARRAAD